MNRQNEGQGHMDSLRGKREWWGWVGGGGVPTEL